MKPKQNSLPNSGMPIKWNEFEEEVKSLEFHLYWQRYPGIDDTLAITPHHRQWEDNISVDYALSRYIRTKKRNLGESKREVAKQGPEIIADLKERLARVDRLLPIARALRTDGRTISIQPMGIVVKEWLYEVTVGDNLDVNIRREIHHCQLTIGDLEQMVTDITHVRSLYETALEAFML